MDIELCQYHETLFSNNLHQKREKEAAGRGISKAFLSNNLHFRGKGKAVGGGGRQIGKSRGSGEGRGAGSQDLGAGWQQEL